MFGIFKTISDVRKGVKDPTSFGEELAIDVVKGPILVFTIIGVLFLLLMFMLGYTEVFGHPYGFFKVVFWLLAIPFFIIDLTLWSVFRAYKALVKSAKKKVDDSKIIDVTPQ
jgi:O-antigen/teichoic acid export membrane protein